MSVYEVIRVLHPVDIEKYVQVLQAEHGVKVNPAEPNSYAVGQPPTHFYHPRHFDEGRVTSIVSFNQEPLPGALVLALANHPELAPATTIVQWLIEQDMLVEGPIPEVMAKLGLTPASTQEPVQILAKK